MKREEDKIYSDIYEDDCMIEYSNHNDPVYRTLKKRIEECGAYLLEVELVIMSESPDNDEIGITVITTDSHDESNYKHVFIQPMLPMKRKWINIGNGRNFDTNHVNLLFKKLLKLPEARWYMSGLAHRISLKDWKEKGEDWAKEKYRGFLIGKKFGF